MRFNVLTGIDALTLRPATGSTKKRIPEAIRKLIIEAIKELKLSDAEISEIYKVKRSTVYSIRMVYLDEGRESISNIVRGRQMKLSDEQKCHILDWVDQDCTLTTKRLAVKVNEEFGIQISRQTVSRILKAFHYSFKRTSSIPERRNDPATIDLRYEFAVKMVDLIAFRDRWFFLDEIGFNVSMRTKYGWSVKGIRANVSVPQIRSRNFSCCATMSIGGLFYFKVLDRPYNSDFYVEYINDIMMKLKSVSISGAIIIADNVRFHHNIRVRNIIQANGHQMVFVAPYSPFLNPIEELFSSWKRNIAARASTNVDELMQAITQTSQEITQIHCQNYVNHMEGYFGRCLHREVIEN